MCTIPNKPIWAPCVRPRKRGFTLLEIMLAVAILSLIAVSIYRFVTTTIAAVRISSEQVRETSLMEAFMHYLREQMEALPAMRQGALTGESHRFGGVPSDELRWIASAGPGLLTRNADGEWYVTLTIQRVKGGKEYDLGFRRQDVDARTETTWLPLLGGVTAFEVRYFDPRAQAWMEKWADVVVRPTLVRVKLWRTVSPDPYEVVFPLPITPIQQMGLPTPPNPDGSASTTVLPAPIPGQAGTLQPGTMAQPLRIRR